MRKGLSMKARQELTKVTSKRYCLGTRKEKTRILDEFVSSTDYNRAYAALLLRNYYTEQFVLGTDGPIKVQLDKKPRHGGGRPRVYDKEVARAVKKLWEYFGFMCGKKLVPLIRTTIPFLKEDPFLGISPEVCTALSTISPATVDRLLRKPKQAMKLKGVSHTRGTKGLIATIPIRTFSEWAEAPPGHEQIDLVGHDGGIASGQFCFTLTCSDVCLGWTERRALLNKAARWVKDAFDDIHDTVPFRILEIHPDSGSEFINRNLLKYCKDNHLAMSRSRPGRKNDNCYVEQKNFDTVRKLVGYVRYTTQEEVDALNQLYRVHGLLLNYFYPSQKLIEKRREGSKIIKRHDAPQTPAERLLLREDVPEEIKERVRKICAELNPLTLAAEVIRLQRYVFRRATSPDALDMDKEAAL